MNNLTDNQKKQDLLLNQRNAQEQINTLLEQSAQALLCGPDCQKQKVSDELNQKYLNAQTALKTAPADLETSKKNYYVYTQGEPAYNNMLEEELKQKADTMAKLLSDSFNEELTSAVTMNKYYNTALINSNYTKDLLNEYNKKNKELKLELRI